MPVHMHGGRNPRGRPTAGGKGRLQEFVGGDAAVVIAALLPNLTKKVREASRRYTCSVCHEGFPYAKGMKRDSLRRHLTYHHKPHCFK
jgi:hypothetical protein